MPERRPICIACRSEETYHFSGCRVWDMELAKRWADSVALDD